MWKVTVYHGRVRCALEGANEKKEKTDAWGGVQFLEFYFALAYINVTLLLASQLFQIYSDATKWWIRLLIYQPCSDKAKYRYKG